MRDLAYEADGHGMHGESVAALNEKLHASYSERRTMNREYAVAWRWSRSFRSRRRTK